MVGWSVDKRVHERGVTLTQHEVQFGTELCTSFPFVSPTTGAAKQSPELYISRICSGGTEDEVEFRW